jgi:hypothetical protein
MRPLCRSVAGEPGRGAFSNLSGMRVLFAPFVFQSAKAVSVILGFGFSDRAPGTTPCGWDPSSVVATLDTPGFVTTAPKKRAAIITSFESVIR